MTTSRSVLLIGGPDAGKTNYLARLCIALHGKNASLHMPTNPNNAEHLTGIATCMLGGKFVTHTPHESIEAIVAPIESTDPASPFSADLVVPDWSGEAWLATFRDRAWPQEWDRYFESSCGFLLFVRINSEQTTCPLDWVGSWELLQMPTPPADTEHKIPTQVMMVDWIQFIMAASARVRKTPLPPRIGVLISAWDFAPREFIERGPDAYLAKEMPLLSQFLLANSDRVQARVFGISSSGGNLDDTAYHDAYLAKDPRAAGYVVSGAPPQQSPDPTVPLRWALGIDDSPLRGVP